VNAAALIEQARALGATFRIGEGGTVKVKSPAPLPDELLAELRQRKVEIRDLLQTSLASSPPGRLGAAILDYRKELALRHRDLESEYYKDDPWVLWQIAILKHHISEIQRFLKEGGELDLPRCCRQAENICLGAVRGFTACILPTPSCGYSVKTGES
jgi:hypothetical protein